MTYFITLMCYGDNQSQTGYVIDNVTLSEHNIYNFIFSCNGYDAISRFYNEESI